jgi:hypothetical protein
MAIPYEEFRAFVECTKPICSVKNQEIWELCDSCWAFRKKCKTAEAIWKSAVYFRLKGAPLPAKVCLSETTVDDE